MEVLMFVVIIHTQRIQNKDICSRLFPSEIKAFKYLNFNNTFVQVASDLSYLKTYKRDFKRMTWKKLDDLTFLQISGY